MFKLFPASAFENSTANHRIFLRNGFSTQLNNGPITAHVNAFHANVAHENEPTLIVSVFVSPFGASDVK